MRVGIIGKGRSGGMVGRFLKEAGHDICSGARAPASLGANDIPEISIEDAVIFGDVVLCSIPFKSWPETVAQLANVVQGKVVIDIANADRNRDDDFAENAPASDKDVAGVVSAVLPGARLVHTFRTIACVFTGAMQTRSRSLRYSSTTRVSVRWSSAIFRRRGASTPRATSCTPA